MYTSDNSHPSIYGSYLAACTFYSTIFRKSSVGCNFFPSAISQADALHLQQVASSTVLDSMSVWNIFQADFDYNLNGKTISIINKSSNFENNGRESSNTKFFEVDTKYSFKLDNFIKK